MTDSKPEGWGIIRPGDRKAHYYRDMWSLCRRVGFYNGSLDPGDGAGPDDCAACRKKLDAEKPKCPEGCGCRVGTNDADRFECGCDGPCTGEL